MNSLQDHIELCRSYIDEINEGESDWLDTEIVKYIDAENRHLGAVVRQKNEDFFGYRHIFPVVTGQNEYFIPRTLSQLRWVEMITSGVTGTPPNYVVDEQNRVFWDIARAQTIKDLYKDYERPWRRRNFSLERYTIFDDQIIFSPGSELSGFIRLWFIRDLPKLHYGNVAAATSNTITLSATPTKGTLQKEDNVYKGSMIGIYSGVGDGQFRRITGYDATTMVATLDEDWLVTPNTSSIYSLISPVPAPLQELLALGACLRAVTKTNDARGRFSGMYAQILKDALADITPRDRNGSRRVRKVRF